MTYIHTTSSYMTPCFMYQLKTTNAQQTPESERVQNRECHCCLVDPPRPGLDLSIPRWRRNNPDSHFCDLQLLLFTSTFRARFIECGVVLTRKSHVNSKTFVFFITKKNLNIFTFLNRWFKNICGLFCRKRQLGCWTNLRKSSQSTARLSSFVNNGISHKISDC